MRSVFVAFDPPMPPTGGGTRTMHMLNALTQISTCDLFICFPVQLDKLPYHVINKCASIEISSSGFNAPKKRRISEWLYNLFIAYLPSIFSSEEIIKLSDYYITNNTEPENKLKRFLYKRRQSSLFTEAKRRYSSGFHVPARALERKQQFLDIEQKLYKTLETADLLWIDFSYPLIYFSKIRSRFPDLKIICNAHNVEFLLYKRMGELSTKTIQKEWLFIQSDLMKELEIEGFQKCNMVFVCSEQDKLYLNKNSSFKNISVIPNGVDVDYFQPVSVETDIPTLLFTGTMTYSPNRDAVHYFVNDVFPIIKEKISTCHLVVAGQSASDIFHEYAEKSDIKLIDSPSDIRPSYKHATIVVVPLRSGSGTRLKILEAMAMGIPVVSTDIGVEGIEAESGIHLFVSSTSVEMANQVIHLLEHINIRKKISTAALDLVQRKYDWKIISEKVLNEISVLSY
jgi:glycosyltransferase involved in cell wall biosynthesis